MALIKGKKQPQEDDSKKLDTITKALGQFKGEVGERGPSGKDGKDAKEVDVQTVVGILENKSDFVARLKGEPGTDGIDGEDGKNPLHVGKEPPTNPSIGDLWLDIST